MRSKGVAVVAVLLAAAMLATAVPAQTQNEPKVKVYIKKTEPHSVATMRHKGPFADLPGVMTALAGEVDKGGYLQAGPVMAMFITPPENTAPKDLEWQVMIPVTEPGPLGKAQFDKMSFQYLDPLTVASTYHIGSYDTVSEAYKTLFDWAKLNRYPIKGFPMEIYWSDPAKVPKDKLVTEVWLPIEERKPAAVK